MSEVDEAIRDEIGELLSEVPFNQVQWFELRNKLAAVVIAERRAHEETKARLAETTTALKSLDAMTVMLRNRGAIHARAAENEACAKVADAFYLNDFSRFGPPGSLQDCIASAIRARLHKEV